MPAVSQVSFFGKVPCALDYVRVHHVSSTGIAFDRWLERAQQELARLNTSWAGDRFRFLFPSATGEVIIGVMAPSRDRAGRRFPAAIYAAVPKTLTARAGLLPSMFSGFFAHADSVLEADLSAGTDALASRLSQAPLPTIEDVASAERSRQDVLDSRSLLDLANADFAADVPSTQDALTRFSLALDTAGTPKERTPVLCCPAREESDVTVWLSLAEKKLGSAAHGLWAFWTSQSDAPRLYLGRGEIPVTLPVWLGSARVKSERFWDLRLTPAAERPEPSDADVLLFQGEKPPSLEQVFRKMLAV